MDKDNKQKDTSVRNIPVDIYKKLRIVAATKEISINAAMVEAIIEYVQRETANPAA